MKVIIKSAYLLTALLMLFFVSCEGDQGPIGPKGDNGLQGVAGVDGKDGSAADGLKGDKGEKGEAGTTGATGATGATGQPGANGADGQPGAPGQQGAQGPAGTANVIYSAWAKPVDFDWSLEKIPADYTSQTSWDPGTSGGTVDARFYTFNAPKVDQAVLDNGVILVYLKTSGTNGKIRLIPLYSQDNVSGVNYRIEHGFHVVLNKIRVYLTAISTTGISVDPHPKYTKTSENEYRYVIIPGGTSARMKSVDYKDYNAVKNAYNLRD